MKQLLTKRMTLVMVILIHLNVLSVCTISAQSISDCAGYNSFLLDESTSNLSSFATNILWSDFVEIDPNSTSYSDFVDNINTNLNLDGQITFMATTYSTSAIDSSNTIHRFQQYYNGVQVYGSGYALTTQTSGGGGPVGRAIPSGTDGPGVDPCDKVLTFKPWIYTDLTLSTIPQIDKVQLPSIISVDPVEIVSTELLIKVSTLCDAELVWKCKTLTNSYYVNATDGTIMEEHDIVRNVRGETLNYGNVEIDALEIDDDLYQTVSSDESVKVYGLLQHPSGHPILVQDIRIVHFTEDKISEFDAVNNQLSYPLPPRVNKAIAQLLYLGIESKDDFNEFVDISFDKIHIGLGGGNNGQHVFGGLNECYIAFGLEDPLDLTNPSRKFFGARDIMLHELTHAYLEGKIEYENDGAAIQEALADIFAEYIESKATNGNDWIIGRDTDVNLRDLRQPAIGCWNQPPSFIPHDRGSTLSYWFYLNSVGQSSQNILKIGMENVFNIMLDAIEYLNHNSTMDDYVDAIAQTIMDKYGRCTPKAISMISSLETLCFGGDYPGIIDDCNELILQGPLSYVCEEDGRDQFTVCLHAVSTNTNGYTWTIIGPNSTQFVTTGNQLGNQVLGGTCLTVTDIPDFDYYPQTITIQFYGGGQLLTKKIDILDCDGSGPSCEDYHNGISNSRMTNNKDDASLMVEDKISGSYVVVYSIDGRKLFAGDINNFVRNNHENSICLIAHFDEQGNFLKTEKVFINKNN